MSSRDKSDHHVFLSYSREDNKAPVNAAGEGWVTAFVSELKRRHAAYSGRALKPFFDQQAIEEGRDWRRELGAGIRQSRLFLAFLSPNYLTSKNCLWEWDEHLRREHSAARGDDGLTPVFFVTPAAVRLPRRPPGTGSGTGSVPNLFNFVSLPRHVAVRKECLTGNLEQTHGQREGAAIGVTKVWDLFEQNRGNIDRICKHSPCANDSKPIPDWK